MKNFLAPIVQNRVVNSVVTTAGTFYLNHESTFLTGGAVGFSLAATAITFKNAELINDVIRQAKQSLALCNTKEEKNDVYKLFLKEVTGLILPIIIFEGASITCSILNKKRSDKIEAKLAETAGALTIAQAAIAQYQAFQREASVALGEEKYTELQNDICATHEHDGKRFGNFPMEGAPGEQLFIDMYTGKPFWCTFDRIENAAKELSRMIGENGTTNVATVEDYHGLIGNVDLTSHESLLTQRMGYTSREDGRTGVSAHFADSHYIYPNGTRVHAAEVYLYPEPRCIDYEK